MTNLKILIFGHIIGYRAGLLAHFGYLLFLDFHLDAVRRHKLMVLEELLTVQG
jgi:hypothetical protein